MSTYADAAALLFGSREFTAREFALRTDNPRAAKVLSELKRRGVVARVGRGRYRCLGPDERPDLRSAEWGPARAAVLRAGLPMAWDGPTAVEVWTEGGYKVSPAVTMREFHIVIPEGALRAWRAYLRREGIPTAPKKRLGVRIVLRVVRSMPRVALVHGEPVLSRAEALRLVRGSPGVYADAERWFRGRAGKA